MTSTNLIKNPGFEYLSDTKPEGWEISSPVASRMPKIEIDQEVFLSGQQSLKMYGNGIQHCIGKVTQRVPVSEGSTYQFSTMIKVKDVESMHKSIVTKLVWYNGESRIGMTYTDEKVEDHGSWSTISKTVAALPKATHVEINLEFRWSAQGSVWWDDVSLVESKPNPSRSIKIGTVYAAPAWPRTIDQNLSLFGRLLDQAGASGCDIVCLPESWAVYGVPNRDAKNEANKIPGVASEMLSHKARQHSMYVVGTLFVWEEDNLYNMAVLYDRQGNLCGRYKKVHLPNAEVEKGMIPGDEVPVFTTDFGTIGMEVCWDNAFPEHARMLALQGAEIIFLPIWGDTRGQNGDMPLTEGSVGNVIARARAIDNGVYIVKSTYMGQSQIIDPGGKILAESMDTATTLLTENIDLDYTLPWNWLGGPGRGEWKSVWRKDRRPELYKLMEKE